MVTKSVQRWNASGSDWISLLVSKFSLDKNVPRDRDGHGPFIVAKLAIVKVITVEVSILSPCSIESQLNHPVRARETKIIGVSSR